MSISNSSLKIAAAHALTFLLAYAGYMATNHLVGWFDWNAAYLSLVALGGGHLIHSNMPEKTVVALGPANEVK